MKFRPRLLGLVPGVVLLLASLTPGAAATTPHKARIDKAVQKLVDGNAKEIGVILHFADAPTDNDGRELLKTGFLPGMIRYKIIPAAFAVGTPRAIEAAARNPRITLIEHDAVISYTLDRATTVGRAKQTWDATYKLNDEVHNDGITGRGIGVAIVDTGIDATNPDLLWEPFGQGPSPYAPKTIANYKIEGRDSVEVTGLVPGADPFLEANQLALDVPHSDNTGGHGTHVAGIAAGNGASSEGKFKGAAPGADLIGYGAGEVLVASMGLAAFDHIHLNHQELGIRVVNNSWGGAGEWQPDFAVTKAARRLVNDDGLVVVFAAGNSGGDGSTLQTSLWGNIPEVIQVASYYDRTGDTSSFSSRGLRNREDTWPDLAAPGEQIISTAAAGGPVSYVCTGQDAAISQLLGPDDTIVVSIPAPVAIGDDNVLVGNYASCSGTSMASPFVAGVSALILEANPALNPFEVRDILRETANMLPGRTYENDGFAIGKGVVDAAEAVAVALKMREGLSLADALGASLVDSDGSPYEINMADPRHLEISSPIEGSDVKSPVHVTGSLVDGPVTDNTIPLLPPPSSPVSGSPNIYVAGAINPFAATPQLVTLVPGEPVELAIRFIDSNDGSIVLAPEQLGRHVVRKGTTVVFEQTTVSAQDASLGTPMGFTTNTEWTVPPTALGSYVFEGYLTVNGTEYKTGSLPFNVVVPVSAQTAPSPSSRAVPIPTSGIGAPTSLGGQSTVFDDGFESGAGDWTVEQNGFGPGLLTDWQHIGTAPVQVSFNGAAHTGDSWFQVGVNATAPFVNGLHYSDMADTTLVSPPIDLVGMSSASFSYWRAGGSEFDFDFLRAYVDPEGPAEPVELEKLSGDLVNAEVLGTTGARSWEQSPAFDLSAFVGQQVRLRFRFTSDDATIGVNTPGWSIDDAVVTAEAGGGGGGGPVGEATLSATRVAGVGSLATSFTFGYTGAGATSFDLDFGDGPPLNVASAAGSIAHSYTAPGQYEAVLTVKKAAVILDMATLLIDVAPLDVVQLRVSHSEGATPWTDAPRDGTGAFNATLDLGSLLGPATIEARHFGADGRQLVKSVGVEVIPANLAPIAVDDSFEVKDVAVLDVLANDSDPDGDVLSIAGAGSLAGTDLESDQGGTLAIDQNKITYTPPGNYQGNDAFMYTISDPLGLTDSASVSLTVDTLPPASPECGLVADGNVTLTADILNCRGDGITVAASGTTIDFAGYRVTGVGKPGSKGVSAAGLSNVTIIGGAVEGFDVGIDLDNVSDSSISNMSVMKNTSVGIRVTGSRNHVSGAALENNGDGIVSSGDGLVLDQNVVTNSAGTGITHLGGDKPTVSSNVVQNSAAEGILVGAASTKVTLRSNQVSNNGGDGMKVDADSNATSVKIDGNSATDNSGFGIRAIAGKGLKVKNNSASGNNAGGQQCFPDGTC